jgi:hypothetical protein
MSTIIGPRLVVNKDAPPAAKSPEIDPTLLNAPAWRMSSAFFNLNERRDVPNTEMQAELHDSGVTKSFEQSFGDFTVSARLTKLRRIEKPTCR